MIRLPISLSTVFTMMDLKKHLTDAEWDTMESIVLETCEANNPDAAVECIRANNALMHDGLLGHETTK